jgi:hypothetical protein
MLSARSAAFRQLSASAVPSTEEYTMTFHTAVFLCTLLLLGACGQSDSQPAPKLFKDQRDVLDQAKTVGPAMQKQDDEQRKAIEQQTKCTAAVFGYPDNFSTGRNMVPG